MAKAQLTHARRNAVLFLPIGLGILAAIALLLLPALAAAVTDFLQGGPVVRFGSAYVLALVVFPIILVVMTLSALSAVPAAPKFSALLGRTLNWLAVVAAVTLLVVMPLLSLMQHHVMPSRGYSKCELLAGQPTLYFNDWVKNPLWCVRGKDLDWVRSQAAASASSNPANASAAAPASIQP